MRIAAIVADGFEDSELKEPYDALRANGHEVVIIGEQAHQKLRGKRGQVEVEADLGVDEARPDDFDVLFIPGGHSPDQLRADDRFVKFAQGFDDKPILAICHGPQILITAGMVRNRRMTAWKTVQTDLHYAGADVVDEPVVVDGSLVTSRQPSDIPLFIERSLRLLEEGVGAYA
jgi:protease I